LSRNLPTLAVLGGSGALGAALCLRWAKAGYPLVIGTRDPGRTDAADAVRAAVPQASVRPLGYADAARSGEIAVLTVPYAAHRATLEAVREAVQGKILIDATAPLRPPKVATVQLPPEGSAAKAAQDFLGAGVRVVSAFQDVAAHKLAELDREIDCDVLVTGNDQEAREQVIQLVEAAGLRGWHAGPIENSAAAEALTSILIAINRRYKIDGAGIRITGVPGGKT
jgi:8-hydroxy-5-deazaflavin:NADPH oxidoreductase